MQQQEFESCFYFDRRWIPAGRSGNRGARLSAPPEGIGRQVLRLITSTHETKAGGDILAPTRQPTWKSPRKAAIPADWRLVIGSERDCSAFAEWSVHARGEELALDVTPDSEEGITAVQAMFDKLRSALATTG